MGADAASRDSWGGVARSAWMTILAFIFGLVYINVLAYLIYGGIYGLSQANPQTMDEALAAMGAMAEDGIAGLALLVGAEVLLTVLELIGRHRAPQSGFTVPIILLPFGRTLRLVLIELVSALVLVPKLLVYLFYIALAPIWDLLFGGSSWASGFLIDSFDHFWEHAERFLRRYYNTLYFTKVDEDADGLTIWFNRILVFWFIHHSKG